MVPSTQTPNNETISGNVFFPTLREQSNDDDEDDDEEEL